jgi:uncharacterized protein with NAD-binding domain and iron-sulfur cluster
MATTKVAVLGGGMAALAAAVELTEPRHKGKFEVHIYQQGWRLGGKCASGRDGTVGYRIYEHGPHILFGWYDNAFALMRGVYSTLSEGGDRRFARFDEALTAVSQLTVMELVEKRWIPWNFPIDAMPGLRPGSEPSNAQIVYRVLDWMERRLARAPGLDTTAFAVLRLRVAQASQSRLAASDASSAVVRALEPLQEFIHERMHDYFTGSDDMRRAGILHDLACSVLLGAFRAGVALHPTRQGIQALNEFEFKDWIVANGAMPTTATSAVVRGIYDTVFGYENGDFQGKWNIEAGSTFIAMRSSISSALAPKWKMRAGTGDILAAPIYELLRNRGVRFSFFHRVDRIEATDDVIDRIRIGRQVTLADTHYEPLIVHNALPCWPDRPLYGQIEPGQAEQLQRRKIDLESYWSGWTDAGEPLVLSRANDDFHVVLLGISLGGLSRVVPDPNREDWSNLFNHVATVPTQTVELWLNETTANSGWLASTNPVVTSFDSTPLNTWFDATDTIGEQDPTLGPIRQLAMICGPIVDPGIPDPSNTEFPQRTNAQVRDTGLAFLRQAVPLWPSLYRNSTFNWETLVADGSLHGEARFADQYWTARINPSDRYVQSLAGSGKYRLAANRSGYKNLALCGDWTDYGLNMGCLEGAVVSGFRAANAITGDPRLILREPYPDTPPKSASRAGNLPKFVTYPGDQTTAGPMELRGTRTWTFVVEADPQKLGAYAKAVLVDPSAGAVTFRPIGSVVLLTFCDFPHCVAPNASGAGETAERELNFSIPGYFSASERGTITAQGPASLLPFLFLDNPVAMMTGREGYGYFKEYGWLTLPATGTFGPFHADAFALAHTNGAWGRERLFDGRFPIEASRFVPDSDAAAQGALSLLRESKLDWPITQIFLKQFRDIADGRDACYQAITIASMTFIEKKLVVPVPGLAYNLTPLVSAPVAETLGIAASGTTGIGVYIEADMRLENGKVLWDASRAR